MTLVLSNADESTDRGPQVMNAIRRVARNVTARQPYQVLAQITAVVGVDLCTSVIQAVVLDERAPLWCPIIVCSGNYLPGQVGMIVSSGRAECSIRCFDIQPGSSA
jgi:hypothetical protein